MTNDRPAPSAEGQHSIREGARRQLTRSPSARSPSDTAHEVNTACLNSLRDMIGQRRVVAQIEVALAAARADGKHFDHALLVGGPGLGKSQTARLIGEEIGAKVHERLGQAITSPADLNALLLAAEDRDVVHIDEAHELGRRFQTALYLALDRQQILLRLRRSLAGAGSIPLAQFTVLLSTTDEFSLLQPLRDRMKLLLPFDFYTEEELTTIVRRQSERLGWQVEEGVFAGIARRSHGTPRLALRWLDACWRVCRAQGQQSITDSHLQKACELEEADDLGLIQRDREYLDIVADGAVRLNVIASKLGLPPRTVSQVIEPFLLRAGLIVKDDHGKRQLTGRGWERLRAADARV